VTLPTSPGARRGTPCRHCRAAGGWYCRGLCRRCWSDQSIRALYPPRRDLTPEQLRGEPGRAFRASGPPPEPTDGLPGSEAKIAALCERAAAGVGLWHPGDALPEKDWR
jgi:hypothetical protein